MSTNVVGNRCCDNLLDRFIKSCPTLSKSSKGIYKVARIFTAFTAALAIFVCALVAINNPNVIFFSQWHWVQLTWFGVSALTALLSLTAWCYFSSVHGRMKEKAEEIK